MHKLVQARWGHIQGYRPVGRPLTVTRAQDSWLMELDHKPAQTAVSHNFFLFFLLSLVLCCLWHGCSAGQALAAQYEPAQLLHSCPV